MEIQVEFGPYATILGTPALEDPPGAWTVNRGTPIF
jgi:hypothetical protein